jgi:hypothetical protein
VTDAVSGFVTVDLCVEVPVDVWRLRPAMYVKAAARRSVRSWVRRASMWRRRRKYARSRARSGVAS